MSAGYLDGYFAPGSRSNPRAHSRRRPARVRRQGLRRRPGGRDRPGGRGEQADALPLLRRQGCPLPRCAPRGHRHQPRPGRRRAAGPRRAPALPLRARGSAGRRDSPAPVGSAGHRRPQARRRRRAPQGMGGGHRAHPGRAARRPRAPGSRRRVLRARADGALDVPAGLSPARSHGHRPPGVRRRLPATPGSIPSPPGRLSAARDRGCVRRLKGEAPMSTGPTALLSDSAPADTARADSRVLHRVGLWVMLAANVLTAWGVQWDIQWHVQIGRDSFWIPPHVMTYTGVTLVVLGAFGVLAIDTLRRLVSGREPAGADRIFGITGTAGFHLAAWGIALAVLAAPIDDLWHRLFGLDVPLWSPPHLLGLLGVAINTMACAVIAREAYPAGRVQLGTVIFALATFYGTLGVGLRESGRIAYVHGGVLFYTFSILGALLLPLALVT